MTPNIIKETSAGTLRYNILDELFQKREIECLGEIIPETVHSLILQLRYLQKEDPEKEITMYIDSPGGNIASGLALYDVMAAIKCPIRTVCVGTAASMGAILFICGNQRDMLPHSKVMIHDPLIAGNLSGNALKIDSVAKSLMETREMMGRIISEHTKRPLEEVFAKTATDSYFNAKEAIEFGLADRVISEI